MSEVNRTIKAMIKDRMDEIHTALPARIEGYNAKTMYAKITLLNKKELEGEHVQIPLIIEVPVAHLNAGGFVIRPPYKKGDIVQVIFNERALDKLLITGESEEPKLTRKFSYDDAVVVKGLKLEGEPDLNSDYTEDLLIENMDGNSRIVLMANESKAFVEVDEFHIGSENAAYRVILAEIFQELYNNHRHNGNHGIPTSVPFDAMTDNEISDTSHTDK